MTDFKRYHKAKMQAKKAVKADPVIHLPPTGFDAYVAKIKRTSELYKQKLEERTDRNATLEENEVVVILNDLVRQADQYRPEPC